MDHGWIKLHRSILEWEWYGDQNTMRVFFHLLIKANHKEKKRYGETVKAGSLLTGRKALAYELGLSEQQIRTSLNKLKSTNEITIKSTNKNSIISITNWNLYQDSNQQSNNPSTSNQPASNHKQECKERNNEINKDPDKKENTGKVKIVSESEISAIKIADVLFEKIKTNNPKALAKKESWIKDIDKCIRIDGRKEHELLEIISWMYTEGAFWIPNVMSGKKLREHFDKMYMQKTNKPRGVNNEADSRQQAAIRNHSLSTSTTTEGDGWDALREYDSNLRIGVDK